MPGIEVCGAAETDGLGAAEGVVEELPSDPPEQAERINATTTAPVPTAVRTRHVYPNNPTHIE
jgi:hypothetical protein